jgi:hypothetical protein
MTFVLLGSGKRSPSYVRTNISDKLNDWDSYSYFNRKHRLYLKEKNLGIPKMRWRRSQMVARRATSDRRPSVFCALKTRHKAVPRLQRGETWQLVPDVARLATFSSPLHGEKQVLNTL